MKWTVPWHLGTASAIRRPRERREVGGAGYSQPFETQAQPRAEIALTAGTPNFSTLPTARGKRTTVVATAVAREMAAFLWAIAQVVAPKEAAS